MSRTGLSQAECAAVLRFWKESRPPAEDALLRRLACLFRYDAVVEADPSDLLSFLQCDGKKVYLEGLKNGDVRTRLAQLNGSTPVPISSALLIVYLKCGLPISAEGNAVRAMMTELRNAVPNASILHWVVYGNDFSSPVNFDLVVAEGFPKIPLSKPLLFEMTAEDIPAFLREIQ